MDMFMVMVPISIQIRVLVFSHLAFAVPSYLFSSSLACFECSSSAHGVEVGDITCLGATGENAGKGESRRCLKSGTSARMVKLRHQIKKHQTQQNRSS